MHGLVFDAVRYDAGVPEGMFGATMHQAAKNATMRQMILDFASDLKAADEADANG